MSKHKRRHNQSRRSMRTNGLTSDRAIKDFSDNLTAAMLRILFIRTKYDPITDERIAKLLEDSIYHVESMLVVREELVKPRLISDANLDAMTFVLRIVNQNLNDVL